MSSMRQLQTGRMYSLPPPAPGIAPTSVASIEEWRDIVAASAGQVALSSMKVYCAPHCVLGHVSELRPDHRLTVLP